MRQSVSSWWDYYSQHYLLLPSCLKEWKPSHFILKSSPVSFNSHFTVEVLTVDLACGDSQCDTYCSKLGTISHVLQMLILNKLTWLRREQWVKLRKKKECGRLACLQEIKAQAFSRLNLKGQTVERVVSLGVFC